MKPINWDKKSRKFLAALSTSGNVSVACDVINVDRKSAYNQRHADAAFAALWDDAIETATDMLELEARRRAHDGCERPVFQGGEEVGRVREYSDTLMILLLKAHRPQKFRDNVAVQHDGGLTIKVEYGDPHDHAAKAPPGAGGDS